MAYLYKRSRSPFWWIGYTNGDRIVRESTGLRHDGKVKPSDAAKQVLHAIEERLARVRYGLAPVIQHRSVREFMAQYQAGLQLSPASVRRYLAMTRNLLDWAEGQKLVQLQEIDYSRGAEYVRAALAVRVDTTVRQEITLFRKMWDEARKCSFVSFDENPWRHKIKCERRRKEAYSIEDLAAIFKMPMPAWMRLCCWISLYTGARGDTIRAVRAEHIGLDLGVINFEKSKTGPYSVPLHPELAAYLRGAGLPESGPILPAEVLEKSESYLSCMFTKLSVSKRGCGFRANFHQFRHTFNSRLLECGATRTQTMFLMNHRSEASNEKYTHVDAVVMAPALARLHYGDLRIA